MSELEDLKAKCKAQARELTQLQESLRRKNLELDALHMVWCDGGCPSGIHRFDTEPISQEMIELAERNTERLRRWWNSAIFRIDTYPTASEWHQQYAERIARKVTR